MQPDLLLQREMDWDLYITNPADLTCICFYLEYLNSANSSVLITLLKKISNLKLTNKQLSNQLVL